MKTPTPATSHLANDWSVQTIVSEPRTHSHSGMAKPHATPAIAIVAGRTNRTAEPRRVVSSSPRSVLRHANAPPRTAPISSPPQRMATDSQTR